MPVDSFVNIKAICHRVTLSSGEKTVALFPRITPSDERVLMLTSNSSTSANECAKTPDTIDAERMMMAAIKAIIFIFFTFKFRTV
jgi:hypothetical protein